MSVCASLQHFQCCCCFLFAFWKLHSVSISACMLLKMMEEDKDEKEAKLEISRSFCWCGSFQLSVCGLTFRLFALKVPSQRPQDFTPELCTATLILGTILLFSLQVTDRNSKLVRQDRLTKKLSAVYVSLRLMVKLQMHTCKRPGNFQGTNQTDTVFAFYRYSQATFSCLPQC